MKNDGNVGIVHKKAAHSSGLKNRRRLISRAAFFSVLLILAFAFHIHQVEATNTNLGSYPTFEVYFVAYNPLNSQTLSGVNVKLSNGYTGSCTTSQGSIELPGFTILEADAPINSSITGQSAWSDTYTGDGGDLGTFSYCSVNLGSNSGDYNINLQASDSGYFTTPLYNIQIDTNDASSTGLLVVTLPMVPNTWRDPTLRETGTLAIGDTVTFNVTGLTPDGTWALYNNTQGQMTKPQQLGSTGAGSLVYDITSASPLATAIENGGYIYAKDSSNYQTQNINLPAPTTTTTTTIPTTTTTIPTTTTTVSTTTTIPTTTTTVPTTTTTIATTTIPPTTTVQPQANLSASITPSTTKIPLAIRTGDFAPIVITIQNTGQLPSNWTIANYPNFLTLSRTSGPIAVNQTVEISGMINASKVPKVDMDGPFNISMQFFGNGFPGYTVTRNMRLWIVNESCSLFQPTCTVPSGDQQFFTLEMDGSLFGNEGGSGLYNFTWDLRPYQTNFGVLLLNQTQAASIANQVVTSVANDGFGTSNKTGNVIVTLAPNRQFSALSPTEMLFLETAQAVVQGIAMGPIATGEDFDTVGFVASTTSIATGVPYVGYSYDVLNFVNEPKSVMNGISVILDGVSVGSQYSPSGSLNRSLLPCNPTDFVGCYNAYLTSAMTNKYAMYAQLFVNSNTTFEYLPGTGKYAAQFVIYPDQELLLSMSNITLPSSTCTGTDICDGAITYYPISVASDDDWLPISSIGTAPSPYGPPTEFPPVLITCGGITPPVSGNRIACGTLPGAFAGNILIPFYNPNRATVNNDYAYVLVPTTPVPDPSIPTISASAIELMISNSTFNSTDSQFVMNVSAPSGAGFKNGTIAISVPQILEPTMSQGNVYVIANSIAIPDNVTLNSTSGEFVVYSTIDPVDVGKVVLQLPMLQPTIAISSEYGQLEIAGGSFEPDTQVGLQYYNGTGWSTMQNSTVNTTGDGEFIFETPAPQDINSSSIVIRAVSDGQQEAIASGLVRYSVSFTEHGLVNGTKWSVTMDGLTETSNGTRLEFSLGDNNYSYIVSTNGNYLKPENGTVQVDGENLALTVNVVAPKPIINLTPNSINIDLGQSVAFINDTFGGTKPYSFAYRVVQSKKAAPTANYMITGNSILFKGLGTYEVQETVTDSNSLTANSAYSAVRVRSVLSVGRYSASNTPDVDAGQYELFRVYASGGTPPYKYNFLVYNGTTKQIVANMLGTANAFKWKVPDSVVGNAVFSNVIVTDSSGIPVSQSSIRTMNIDIFGTLTLKPVISSLPGPKQLQNESLTESWSGGTPPYSVSFLVTNSVTGSDITNDTVTTPNDSAKFAFQVPDTSNALGEQDVKVAVLDSAATPVTKSTTNTITVKAA